MNDQIDSNFDGYYDNVRPEIISLIDKDMLMILDVGCGHGNLGRRLKQVNFARKVFGIEYHGNVAEIAKKNLDEVIVGDVQTINFPFDRNMFDCIIFADILEHLIDPTSILQKVKPFLKDNGIIICSIPNMRHYAVILRMIMQGWQYDDFGHFDKTHLRFFSLQSMKELISGAGYSIEQIIPRIVASKKMKLINSIVGGKMEEFVAFQYIIKAHKI